MISNKETIEKIAFEFLKEKKIKYSKICEAAYVDLKDPSNEFGIDYWVVPYEYIVFQDEDAFIYIDDLSQKVLQILTKHGIKYNSLP